MALEYKDCFPITNSATFYDPGTDNAHGDSKNGGRDTHTGRLYYNNESVCATPWRNEVIRLREVLDGKIDPRRMAEGEIGLVVKNGVAVVALSQDVGGLEVPQYSRSVDKRGIPHSDIDLSRKLVSQLPGMKVVGDGLEGKDGIAVYSLGMVTSSAGLSQKSPEQIKKLKDDLTKIEQEVAQYGRVPIYRPEEQKFGRGFDANGRRLSFTDNEAKAFWAKYENIRSEIYPKPTITQLDAAQKLVEKVNNKEADISELKSVLGQVYSPEMLQDKRISQIDTSSIKAGAEKELTPGGAYTAYNPKDIKQSPTKEQVESTLTAGMERQQSGESGSEYDSRKRNYMADMLAMLSPEQRLIVAVLAVIFGLIDPEGMGQMMASFQGEDNNRGYGNGYTNSDVGADRARYNDKGVLGGRVEGLEVAQGRALQLLKFDSSKYKNVGEYFAANAKKFEGVSEQGGNNCGPMVKWVMANAGHSEGQPWCAGFSSKMYEGTGLYNYTAAAINFAEQGAATQSYRPGLSKINDIELGDTVVFSRDGGNHVGIVTAITKNADNKVENITTTEGNTDNGVVASHKRTPSELIGNRYIGYVDISDREQKLIAQGALKQPIIETLKEKYSVDSPVKPEITPPPTNIAIAAAKPVSNPLTATVSADRGEAQKEQTAAMAGKNPINYSRIPEGALSLRAKALNDAQNYVSEQRKLNPNAEVIVLDAGHGAIYGGARDTGTVKNGMSEEKIVSEFTPALADKLRSQGKIVVETQKFMDGNWGAGSDAKWFSLVTRKEIAAHTGAASFVSIHADEGKEAGLKTYYYGDQRLAQSLTSKMGGIGTRDDSTTGVGNVKVLRAHENIPSALIELGSIETSDRNHLNFATTEGKKWKQDKVEKAAEALSSHAQIVTIIKEKKDEKAAAVAPNAPVIDSSKIIDNFDALPPGLKESAKAKFGNSKSSVSSTVKEEASPVSMEAAAAARQADEYKKAQAKPSEKTEAQSPRAVADMRSASAQSARIPA